METNNNETNNNASNSKQQHGLLFPVLFVAGVIVLLVLLKSIL